MADIIDIEGIGPAYAEKLKIIGIITTEKLLEQGATPQGRKTIADKTGISDTLVLKWVNHADLFRLKGVASQYAELLEASGVDTVPELAQRNAANLHTAMMNVADEKKLVRKPPAMSQIEEWIAQAKALPRIVKY